MVLILAGLASPARADRLWALQLRGGSIVLSLDSPEERGAALVFHRHPDGVFSSLRTDEVRRISIAEGPSKKPRRSIEGEMLILGGDADPPERRPPPPLLIALSPEPGYDVLAYGGGTAPARPRHRRFPPTSNIGPNGFPVIAPPGSPGARPPVFGPNGFPILVRTPPPGR